MVFTETREPRNRECRESGNRGAGDAGNHGTGDAENRGTNEPGMQGTSVPGNRGSRGTDRNRDAERSPTKKHIRDVGAKEPAVSGSATQASAVSAPLPNKVMTPKATPNWGNTEPQGAPGCLETIIR